MWKSSISLRADLLENTRQPPFPLDFTKSWAVVVVFQGSREGGGGTVGFIDWNLRLARLSLVKQLFSKELEGTYHPWPGVGSLALTLAETLVLACACAAGVWRGFVSKAVTAVPRTVSISFLKLLFLRFTKEGSYIVSSNQTFKVRRPLLLSKKKSLKECHRVDYME